MDAHKTKGPTKGSKISCVQYWMDCVQMLLLSFCPITHKEFTPVAQSTKNARHFHEDAYLISLCGDQEMYEDPMACLYMSIDMHTLMPFVATRQ